MEPVFLDSPADLRSWFERHHANERELLIGFHKRASGRASLTYQEALDEALCFGWIDGVRRGLGDDSYTIRFTPRKPRSSWSQVNIRRAEQLKGEGRMAPAGLAAFDGRDETRTKQYSFEQGEVRLTP